MKRILPWLLAILFLLCACGEVVYTAQEDEVRIVVELDTEDDIYEVSFARCVDGEAFGGCGVSNADRSRLGYNRFGQREKNPKVLLDFLKEDFPNITDLSGFSMQLYVRNSPLEGVNWDEPFDGTVEVQNELAFPVEYGHLYRVRLSGSREKGYTATYLGEQEG